VGKTGYAPPATQRNRQPAPGGLPDIRPN
jgi:hypothetical protein